MPAETKIVEVPTPQPDIVIIGRGDIGDKASQLVAKTPVLKRVGFHVARRTILAEDVFDEFFQYNGLGDNLRSLQPSPDSLAHVRQGVIPPTTLATLNSIIEAYDGVPVAIRSSGHGDARGNGIYSSEFSGGSIRSVGIAFKAVLASYFSEKAVAFRRDAHLAEGFGIIIEPLIGQVLDKTRLGREIFAPVLSGFGYTSTLADEGYVVVVPGLGGGVETRDGLKVTKKEISHIDIEGSVLEYILRNRSLAEATALSLVHNRKENSSNVFILPTATDVGQSSMFYIESSNYDHLLARANILTLFDMAKEIERALGRPQYFEWAYTDILWDRQPSFWITQIADVDTKLDFIDFSDLGEPLFEGHTAVGTGIKECKKLVLCTEKDSLDRLAEFNAENEEYLLVYSSKLTSRDSNPNLLDYHHYSNAAALVEIPGAHVRDALGHMQEDISETDKLFGILKRSGRGERFLGDRTGEEVTQEHGLEVINRGYKVVASERQNRLVIYRS